MPIAQSFDTGFGDAIRSLVVADAITRLMPLHQSNGLYLSSVFPFGGIVRTWTDNAGCDMLRTALLGATPAIGIAAGRRGGRPVGTTGFKEAQDLELMLYLINDHKRDAYDGRLSADVATALNPKADPGMFIMLEHSEELLAGARIETNGQTVVKQYRFIEDDELWTDTNMTIWCQRFEVTVARGVNMYRGLTQKLESIRIRTTIEDSQAKLPAAATSPTTIDANRDGLPT